ncbi:hypothetical protein QL285_025419 [Trifolium repens]|nr:hypothetical protein QL285_025419 [Trifolium repens]
MYMDYGGTRPSPKGTKINVVQNNHPCERKLLAIAYRIAKTPPISYGPMRYDTPRASAIWLPAAPSQLFDLFPLTFINNSSERFLTFFLFHISAVGVSIKHCNRLCTNLIGYLLLELTTCISGTSSKSTFVQFEQTVTLSCCPTEIV